MDFITFRYNIITPDGDCRIEEGYVLVSVLKNMQLLAEMRFFPMGNHVAQKHCNFVHCSDDAVQEKIFDKANKLAREHKLLK